MNVAEKNKKKLNWLGLKIFNWHVEKNVDIFKIIGKKTVEKNQ